MKIIDIKNMKAYRIEDAQNLKQAITILHRTVRYHYTDRPALHISVPYQGPTPVVFTAAPETTEAPEYGTYANSPVYSNKATDKQVRALIYTISKHAIKGKALHLPQATSLTKAQVTVCMQLANDAPAIASDYKHYAIINNWFAKQYTDHDIPHRVYSECKNYANEFLNQQAKTHAAALQRVNQAAEDAEYAKYNF